MVVLHVLLVLDDLVVVLQQRLVVVLSVVVAVFIIVIIIVVVVIVLFLLLQVHDGVVRVLVAVVIAVLARQLVAPHARHEVVLELRNEGLVVPVLALTTPTHSYVLHGGKNVQLLRVQLLQQALLLHLLAHRRVLLLRSEEVVVALLLAHLPHVRLLVDGFVRAVHELHEIGGEDAASLQLLFAAVEEVVLPTEVGFVLHVCGHDVCFLLH